MCHSKSRGSPFTRSVALARVVPLGYAAVHTYSPLSSRTMFSSVRVEVVRVVRGVLGVISVVPLYQVREGGGDPGASHRNVAECPIDTDIVSGVTVGVAAGDEERERMMRQLSDDS